MKTSICLSAAAGLFYNNNKLGRRSNQVQLENGKVISQNFAVRMSGLNT